MNLSHFYEEAVRLGVERVAHISQAFLCAYGVLIPLPCCSPKFATFARTANALVGIDDPTPAEADLSVPIFEKMTLFVEGVQRCSKQGMILIFRCAFGRRHLLQIKERLAERSQTSVGKFGAKAPRGRLHP